MDLRNEQIKLFIAEFVRQMPRGALNATAAFLGAGVGSWMVQGQPFPGYTDLEILSFILLCLVVSTATHAHLSYSRKRR